MNDNLRRINLDSEFTQSYIKKDKDVMSSLKDYINTPYADIYNRNHIGVFHVTPITNLVYIVSGTNKGKTHFASNIQNSVVIDNITVTENTLLEKLDEVGRIRDSLRALYPKNVRESIKRDVTTTEKDKLYSLYVVVETQTQALFVHKYIIAELSNMIKEEGIK